MSRGAPRFHHHASAVAAANALADSVAATLAAAIARRRRAILAVPGGRTPVAFFRALRTRSIAWDRVRVTLTDERLGPDEPRGSNADLLLGKLLQGPASAARFVGLLPEADEVALPDVESRIRELAQPVDILVLGMGADGHVASLFPNDAASAKAMVPGISQLLCHTRRRGEAPARVGFTLAGLRRAECIQLLFSGSDKLEVWHRANAREATGDLPIGRLLAAGGPPVDCHYYDGDLDGGGESG